MSDHPNAATARRLKRANSHLEKIIEMVEQGRPCAQIAQQLQSAIESAKKSLIHDHIGHSLDRSFDAPSVAKGRAIVRGLKLITKYL